jgi:uncharacterized protein DUF4389
MAYSAPYPVRLEGHLEQPSRWLWLFKWLLLIPHVIVLVFLWVAFVLLSVVAFLVLFFGGRYPRGIFDFNVGVLRWTWRVGFYAFAANGTDRYPPFSLADVRDFPARLEVEYPENQRHGFPLLGWWLAGAPQYCIASIFAGAGGGVAWNASTRTWSASWIGLIDLLVFFAVVALLFKGSYPRSIFDLVLGFNRWVLRVGAYGALLTREYPPFRIDTGEDDPGGLAVSAQPLPAAPADARDERWGAGRIIGTILASVGVLIAVGAIAAGGTGIVYDQTQRDASGYLMTSSQRYHTSSYAFVSRSYRTGAEGNWFVARDLLGTVRVHTVSVTPVFVGIGPAADVNAYLAGVQREVGRGFDGHRTDFDSRGAHAPAGPPTDRRFWVARTAGAGTEVLTWSAKKGNWRVVLMNADGSKGVNATVSIGAKFPHLLWLGVGTAGVGALLLLLSGAGLYAAVHRRR